MKKIEGLERKLAEERQKAYAMENKLKNSGNTQAQHEESVGLHIKEKDNVQKQVTMVFITRRKITFKSRLNNLSNYKEHCTLRIKKINKYCD